MNKSLRYQIPFERDPWHIVVSVVSSAQMTEERHSDRTVCIDRFSRKAAFAQMAASDGRSLSQTNPAARKVSW